ncbi:MAG: hypothetical protein AB8G22_00345 [Saprospiraceae bacterium]
MRLLFFLICCLGTHLSFGQATAYTPPIVPEPLEVHFNQDFYATGEDIWYKIYVLHDDIRDIRSRIVHVEWLDTDNDVIARQALEITGNYALGDFNIPFDWQEGNYTFRAYTTWSLNFGEAAVLTQPVPIYQISAADTTTINPPLDTLGTTLQTGDLNIRFFTQKQQYERRDAVTLIMDVRDNENRPVQASVSLAVTDDNFLPAPQLAESMGFPSFDSPKDLPYTAEERLTVTGNLLDILKKEPLSSPALSLFLPDLKRFYRAGSQQGTFSWDLPDFYQPTTLQVLDLNIRTSELMPILKPTDLNIKLAKTTNNQLVRNGSIQFYLHQLYKKRLLEEVFKMENPTPTFVKEIQSIPAIPADKTYTTKGFINIRDVGEFIDEVILIARVTGTVELQNRTVLLFNQENKTRFKQAPIYLVNGQITTDENAVLSLPIAEIENIKTYVNTSTIDQYFDPLFINRGVLEVITKNGLTPDFITSAPNRMQLSGLVNPRNFAKATATDNRTPTLRPTIYWDGKIITGANGKANVTFPMTDTSGKIWVEIEGISVSGKRGKLVKELKVR